MNSMESMECNLSLHGDCDDSVWNGVDLLFCGCPCHPVMTPECHQGLHGDCRQPKDVTITFGDRTDRYNWSHTRICDCPCHFIQTRQQLMVLRTRVA